MKIKKLLVILGVTVIAAMAFVGCSSEAPQTEDTQATTPAEDGTQPEEEVAPVEETAPTDEANATDGVYRVEYEADEQGWKTFLEVTVKDGAIANVNFDEVNINDEEADNALEQALLTATTPEEFEQMIEGQVEADAFKALLAQLMPQIEQGNTETIIVNK